MHYPRKQGIECDLCGCQIWIKKGFYRCLDTCNQDVCLDCYQINNQNGNKEKSIEVPNQVDEKNPDIGFINTSDPVIQAEMVNTNTN